MRSPQLRPPALLELLAWEPEGVPELDGFGSLRRDPTRDPGLLGESCFKRLA